MRYMYLIDKKETLLVNKGRYLVTTCFFAQKQALGTAWRVRA
jgi:hypothetical protein